MTKTVGEETGRSGSQFENSEGEEKASVSRLRTTERSPQNSGQKPESEKEDGEISSPEEREENPGDARGDSSEGEPEACWEERAEMGSGESSAGLEAGEEMTERPDETIDEAADPFQPKASSLSEELVSEELSRVTARKAETPSPENQVETLRKLLEMIRNEPEETSPDLVRQALSLLSDLPNQIPSHEKFMAGSFQSYFPAWAELLRSSSRKSSKSVLSWLKHGFRPRMEGTANAKQDKLRIVEAMLKKVVGPGKVRQYLEGKRPRRIEFPNHKSFYDHFEFAVAETRKNLESGAVEVWLENGEPPEIIHPMGVVESAGKQRLICNDRYLNIFLKQIPFQYERFRDVLTFTLPGSFMTTADLKSGYFHVPIHPAYWKYFAFKIGKKTFFYKVLCFGFAQACWVFTMVMREPILELRKLSIPLSGYIDDLFSAAKSFGKALRQILFTVLLFAALGAFFGLPKCQLLPLLRLKWLGFIVDSEAETFALTEARLQKITKALEEIVEQKLTSARAIAQLAGMLASAAPAILPVSLYSRSLYQALSKGESWDSLFPTPETVIETADFWRENLEKFNGRRWWARPKSVEVVMDASAVGFGGFVQTDSGRKFQVAGTFTLAEAQRSSTEREVQFTRPRCK